MSNPKILVFDSGVGGLSILNEIQRQVAGCELMYACDNEAFPYGTKSEEELIARVDHILKKLTAAIQPDIVVIACNSASTVALPHIRSHFKNPVVGVVPAIKPAAAMSKTKVIGLLATPGTINRPYTQQLINDFASQCELISIGSSELVEMAEEKIREKNINLMALKTIVSPFFEHPKLDSVVLACTHFPLLADELEKVFPRQINWVDSGEAIARRVNSLLEADQSRHNQNTESLLKGCFYTEAEQSLEHAFRCFGFNEITVFDS